MLILHITIDMSKTNGIIIKNEIYKAVKRKPGITCENCDLYMEICRGGKKRMCLPFGSVVMKHMPVIYIEPEEKTYRCHQCGREYNPGESEANMKDSFCCIACEYGY